MFRSFLISMFAILLFALGATGAWFYLQLEKSMESEDDSLPRAVAAQPKAPPDPVPKFQASLPAPVRGSELTPEEMYKIESATAAQRELLIEHEARLREQKRRIVTSNADTEAAQREVEGALEQVRSMLDATQALLDEVVVAKEDLKKQSAELQQKMAALKELEANIGAGAKVKLKKIAEIIAGMPAVDSAGMMAELSREGDLNFAVQLLDNLETRSAAKVLSEIKDEQLRAELTSRLRDMIQLK